MNKALMSTAAQSANAVMKQDSDDSVSIAPVSWLISIKYVMTEARHGLLRLIIILRH